MFYFLSFFLKVLHLQIIKPQVFLEKVYQVIKTGLNMNNVKFLIILFFLTISNMAHAMEDKIIAVVNDNVVLKSELNNKLTTINLEGTSRLEAAKLKREILDQLIEESLLEQAANRLGIYISDIDLQNRIKLIAQDKNLTVLQLKEAVESQNIDYLRYLKNLRKRIQIEELFRIQFTSRAYVSEEEIQSYLKTNDSLKIINNIMTVREYLIEDENNKLDITKVDILVRNIKTNGLEDTYNRYPNIKIKINNLSEIPFTKLPDIYQNNLNILDQNSYTDLFKTGKGYVFLEVVSSSMYSEEYKVSHILLKTNPMENLKSLKERFYKIKRDATKENNFSDYAQKYSLDKASAIKGGSLGWINKKLVVPEFGRIMSNMKIGGISEPFKTQFGWHILQLEDKRIKNISNDVARNQVVAILKERKVKVAKREWLAKLKDQAYIEIIE
uniref:Predicted survival protein surA n=1 Tax=uncultured bacterium BAC13K9BAC TaxID=332979 RepID=Q4JN68_9BACT|nr:predicted survival protein surA [uncultured bacterium BAC13K9BAC]